MAWPSCMPRLIQKNFTTEIRCWRRSVIEVVIILVLFAVILWNPVARTYRYDNDAEHLKVKFYDKESLEDLTVFRQERQIKRAKLKLSLAYTPITPTTTKIIEEVVDKLLLNKAIGYKDAFRMEAKFNNKSMLAAIDFENFDEAKPKTLSLTIRFHSCFRTIEFKHVKEFLWVTRCNGILEKGSEFVGNTDSDLYTREGFLQLQHQIFLAWLKATNVDLEQEVEIRSFQHDVNPYECDVVVTGSNLLFLLFYLCFLFPFLNLIKRLGYEREKNVYVHHLKFGVRFQHHWMAHFIVAFAHFSVLILIIFIIGKIHWVHDDYTYHFGDIYFWKILIFLILYITALIITAMALVALTPVVTNALLLACLIWITTYGMFSIILYHTKSLYEFWVNLAFIIFFNNTFPFSMVFMRDYEPIDNDKNDIWILYGALLGNIFLHLTLLYHFQWLWPGRYIQRRPYNFLHLSYFKRFLQRKKENQSENIDDAASIQILQGLSWTNIENAPLFSDVIVELKNIDTIEEAKTDRVHLINISMKIYRGEITMLMGHNGCGKTTLLSIIAGRFEPEAGTVLIKGLDVYDEWDEARHYLDVCMPETPLFAKLNARETLLYYCGIKRGNADPDMDAMEVSKWVEYLKIAIDDMNMLVDKMTYEQQRLLFLCCALSCGTEVLLLDEPTQYMRWRESQLYWHILAQEKPNRAIIITSNSVDITDRHADRILIMHEGMSLAYGSKFFLKSSFGLSYQLTIMRDPSLDIEPITKIIGKHIKGIQPDSMLGDQLIYKISKEKTPSFQRILISLEKEASVLGIQSITLFGSELHDVYMNLAYKANNQVISDHVLKHQNIHYLKDNQLRRQQVKAMAFKKVINQAPTFIPLAMMFVVFFLTVAIQNMSKVLQVPPKEDVFIELGLPRQFEAKTTKSRVLTGANVESIFEPLVDCNTICIKHIGGSHEYKSHNPRVYGKSSLQCIERSTTYKEYISQGRKMAYTIGGVEIHDTDGKLAYTAWFNKKIFHSAPVVLNLVHNLILSRANGLNKGGGGDKPAEVKPPDEKPTEDPANPDEKPTEEPAKPEELPEEKPTDETPPEETPTDDKPTEETPAEETPTDDKPTEETPTDDKPAEETPTDDKPAEETPTDDKPPEDKPAEGKIPENKPTEDNKPPFITDAKAKLMEDDVEIIAKINKTEKSAKATENELYATYLLNDPMPIPLETKVNLMEIELHHIVLPLTVGLIMPLTVASFIINIIDESETQLLWLMRMAGLKMPTYWLMTYIWDVCTFFAYTIFYVCIMAFSTIDGFGMFEKIVTFLMLMIYSLSAIPLTHLISLFCTGSRLGAYLKASLVHVFTGLFFYVIYWDVLDNSKVFFAFAMIFPTFALLEALSNMYTEVVQQQYCQYTCKNLLGCSQGNICSRIPYCCFDTFFKWNNPGIYPSITCLIATAFLYFGLIFWIEVYRDENRFATIKNLKYLRTACYPYDDPDVIAVKKRVAEYELREIKHEHFVVDQLECEIPKKSKNLHTVSFAVDPGRCLAIWGPRKCGKTHLVKQLIGQHSFCFGDIYVKGTELKYETEIAHFMIGYCPQDRGVFSNFTPRELLHVFCMIRGIPENEIGEFIIDITKALDMRGFMNRRLYALTHDMRRKILIALAFLVNNEIIILDEPTRGLNALSRRQIWNLIRFACLEGKAVIFTTVGSPECTTMADDCMIFEDGEMLAYGSMQHLRQRHTQGFYFEAKLKMDGETIEIMMENLRTDIQNLHRFATFIHEESEVRSIRGNAVRYYCPVKNILFSRVFGAIEKNRKRLNIVTYLVTQGNMEETFANIASTRLHKTKMDPNIKETKPKK